MLPKLLEYSRVLLVLPVIGSLLLTVSVVLSGVGTILVEEWNLVQQGEFSARTAKQLTVTVIQTIDMFLLGAISYIVAVGIYKLFISQEEGQLLKRIKIENLADLEHKIIGVRRLALASARMSCMSVPRVFSPIWSGKPKPQPRSAIIRFRSSPTRGGLLQMGA